MKKTVYIALTIILGILFSIIVHALIELWYLNWAENIVWTSIIGKANCALPLWLQWGLIIVGVVGGYLVGRFWWKLVYGKKSNKYA